MTTTIKVARGADPFKKYWWVILLVFGAIGGWVCIPLLDSSTGSGSVNVAQEGGLKGVQSLDALHNPTGAPGSALDLSMAGAAKKEDPAQASSLYQPPPEPAASTGASAQGESLADALKGVARKPSASVAVDPRGWGEKAQRGFSAPKANFGALSGFGGSSGSSAGAGSSGGTATGLTGFGASKPNTGVDFAKGLQEKHVGDAKGKAMNALEKAKDVMASAARQGSNDAASAMSGLSFDGSRGGSQVGGNNGHAVGAGGYAALDAAPVNLKANDPNLDKYKYEPKPPPIPEPKQDNSQMKMMMMMMLMQVVMGGLMGGLGGGA